MSYPKYPQTKPGHDKRISSAPTPEQDPKHPVLMYLFKAESENTDDQCAICFEPLEIDGYIVHNECCRLVTHLGCLYDWANIIPVDSSRDDSYFHRNPFLDPQLAALFGDTGGGMSIFTCPKCRQKMNRPQFNEVVAGLVREEAVGPATVGSSFGHQDDIPVIEGLDPTADNWDNGIGLEEILFGLSQSSRTEGEEERLALLEQQIAAEWNLSNWDEQSRPRTPYPGSFPYYASVESLENSDDERLWEDDYPAGHGCLA